MGHPQNLHLITITGTGAMASMTNHWGVSLTRGSAGPLPEEHRKKLTGEASPEETLGSHGGGENPSPGQPPGFARGLAPNSQIGSKQFYGQAKRNGAKGPFGFWAPSKLTKPNRGFGLGVRKFLVGH